MNKKDNIPEIILASASPRRKQLLEGLNLDFKIIPSEIEEIIDEKVFSNKLIEDLALEKAIDVRKKINYPAVIIGADTVVVIDNRVLGKPKDRQEAFEMIKMLQGKTHKVVSAIAVIDTRNEKILTDSVESRVSFKPLSDNEINSYIDTGEPMDKAGAYAIQGVGSILVSSICGCYSNIVGISTYKLAEMLKEFGIYIL